MANQDKTFNQYVKIVGQYSVVNDKIDKNQLNKYIGKIRDQMTGENLVDQIIPNQDARHDDTLVQKEEIKSRRFRNASEMLKNFKPDSQISNQASQDAENIPNLTHNPAIAGVKDAGILYQFGKSMESVVKYAYHCPHIIHLKNISTHLLSSNRPLQKFLMNKYHNGRNVVVATENIENQKRNEIALTQRWKYTKDVSPMTYHEDPYLRIVLYASTHKHPDPKQTHGVSLSTLSAHVIIRQIHYHYNPLEQHKYDLTNKMNQESLKGDTETSPFDKRIYKEAKQQVQNSSKHIHINQLPQRMWENAQKLNNAHNTSIIPVKQPLNFNTKRSKQAINKMINNSHGRTL